MAYTKHAWLPKGSPGALLITSQRLNEMETGIADAHAGANVPLVTSLTPGQGGIPNPVTDGFRVDYLADATNGIIWPLRYRSASASAYKWEVVGSPPPLFSYVDGNSVVNTRGYASYGGPSLVLPLAGDYETTYGARAIADAGAGGHDVQASYSVNGAAPIDDDGINSYSAGGTSNAMNSVRTRIKLGLPASCTLVEQAYSDVGNAGLSARWLRVVPRRVG